MVCLGKGRLSILDPADKVPQDENKTKISHSNCSFLCDSCHCCPSCGQYSHANSFNVSQLYAMQYVVSNTVSKFYIELHCQLDYQ